MNIAWTIAERKTSAAPTSARLIVTSSSTMPNPAVTTAAMTSNRTFTAAPRERTGRAGPGPATPRAGADDGTGRAGRPTPAGTGSRHGRPAPDTPGRTAPGRALRP